MVHATGRVFFQGNAHKGKVIFALLAGAECFRGALLFFPCAATNSFERFAKRADAFKGCQAKVRSVGLVEASK